MERNNSVYNIYLQILREELIPAMGCTEPIALAYAAAKARLVLGAIPEEIHVLVSNNIIKNVKSVVVPNTRGLRGIESAVAAGIIGGNASKVLEVLSEVTEKEKENMRTFLSKVPITVNALESDEVFDIIIELKKEKEYVKIRISQYHTNIVSIEKNGTVIYQKDNKSDYQEACSEKVTTDHHTDLNLLNLEDIIQFAECLAIEDIKELLHYQIQCNMAIAQEGLTKPYGANIGSTFLKYYGDDVRNRAIAMAAAGSDARMSGCEMPVVINSGSGNQGIAVSVPVVVYARELNVSDEKLYRALVISNLVAIHEKSGIGRLSAYCGAVSAGCAAGCGIAYLMGGGYAELAHTLVNSLAIVSGIICDGAKASCAAKIASSVEAGLLGYHMFMNGQEFKAGDGIVSRGVEKTIQNVGILGKEGMRETDKEIVKMMLSE